MESSGAESTMQPTAEDYLEQPGSDEKPDYDPYLIDSFEEGDPANPQNWSKLQRWYLTVFSGLLVLNATFASAARQSNPFLRLAIIHGIMSASGIAPLLAEHYHLSAEGTTLALSLFIIFQVAAALANNAASLLIFRFIGGMFAAAPLTNSGAIIADVWDASTRGSYPFVYAPSTCSPVCAGKALALFTLAPFAGKFFFTEWYGFIAVTGTDFHWIFWIQAIFAAVCTILAFFTVPETYVPVLLVAAAAKKRDETGDAKYYARLETAKVSMAERFESIVARPFKVLGTEPMLIVLTFYMSFVYGCLYLLFEAYPIVFTRGHGLNPGVSGLTFFPILLGGVAGVMLSIIVFNPRYEKKVAELAPAPVPPEFRLEMTLLAAPLYAISFFWFGWTSYPSISLWAPMMSGGIMGLAINGIFLSLFNYIIDTYLHVAATALAANTIIRSIFGAVFPLFATQMFDGLGPQWAASVLGFVALAMVPVPIVLIRYGPYLRSKSRHAPT
ncbi:unnamed protein product [Mycena citricolor]|uniref:MFS general substrate transporter n=1 Tax=Mycena citricolor TaxID=2018698 RepID=A0AAD2Q150_9AGAR|nr:unnamed protein product [Mycena citricolor]